ncbi:MAG: hypothetical protein ACI8QC_000224 [Planctomycetota bacterium]|jgi:hypothetical protein
MRINLRVLCPLFLALAPAAVGQTDLSWYLPEDGSYDAEFPVPADVLGWQVGDWHVRHDQLVDWYRTVAEASPRVMLETYGYSHEQRPLLLATVSSPANLARIEEIRTAHVRSVLEDKPNDGPAIVWMGYSVHGNEPSGSNAALVLAYHLAAAEGQDMQSFLENTVVLIDPCVNPDGLARHAQWVNMHKGRVRVGDPAHRERREAWPGGRTNHYWFDLNRDWLLQSHPESQGRLVQFHRWMPSVLTDYHEMGGDSTYFFQPGIPSRRNPLTPEKNVELTGRIAAFHAEALDAIGSLYYTEESFDDFYYGKGSTYPDINGSIGILFEQASSGGALRENSYGELSFPFTIRNQFTTSLSTLRAVNSMRSDLEAYQRGFYRGALAEAAEHEVGAYVFGAKEDPERTFQLVDLLRRHRVEVHLMGSTLSATEDSPMFVAGRDYVVPMQQTQFRLIRALFEHRTSWPDNTFYDVSSWTLPESFNVPARAIAREGMSKGLVGMPAVAQRGSVGHVQKAERPAAWLFEWHNYNAPKALQRLLAAGVRARVATKPFSCRTAGGELEFDHGTVVISPGVQDVSPERLRELLHEVANDGIEVYAATSGLTPVGVDLGSGSMRPLEAPQVALMIGPGVSSYEAGEAWHYMDKRLGLPVSLIEKSSFGSMDLERYTHIVMVQGGSLASGDVERLNTWVRAGGVVIATKGSATWAADAFLSKADESEEESDEKDAEEEAEEQVEETKPSYADYSKLRAEQNISGTIFATELDLTHPICFGYVREALAVFRNSTRVLPEGNDPFATPVRYLEEPLISGFASAENVEEIAGSPAVRAERVGSGAVICLVDNPNFRGVWYGTNKLFANAIYFGRAIQRTGPIGKR